MSTRPSKSPSWARNWARPSSTDRVQILVATMASERRSPSARESTLSARPYIGEESTRRVPAANATSTTSRATCSCCRERSNVLHVPSPTTGTTGPLRPKARSSTGKRRSRWAFAGLQPIPHGDRFIQGVDGKEGFGMAALAAEFVRPARLPPRASGGGGWGLLILLVAIAAVVVALLVGRIVLRSAKGNKAIRTLMADVWLEASTALKNPVLVHQARRTILRTRERRSG